MIVNKYMEPKVFHKHIDFMRRMHAGQLDKAGCEYWRHPMRVARIVHSWRQARDVVSMSIALFHDIAEDVRGGRRMLEDHVRKSLSYSDEEMDAVLEGVDIVTQREDERYMKYIDRVFSSGNRWACFVKFADIRDHLERLDFLGENERLCMAAKYSDAFRVGSSWMMTTV